MDKEFLARRYRYLWIGEAVSATLFVILLVTSAVREGFWFNWIARAYSVGVVVWILIQAIVFWRWKLRLLVQEQRTFPAKVVLRFRSLKHLNWILIGAFPLVVLVEWHLAIGRLSRTDVGLGILFLAGAILEQVNYYYYQLKYDSRYDWRYLIHHKRLRVGSIASMLAQGGSYQAKVNS